MINWAQSFLDDDDDKCQRIKERMNNGVARDCVGFCSITAFYLWDLPKMWSRITNWQQNTCFKSSCFRSYGLLGQGGALCVCWYVMWLWCCCSWYLKRNKSKLVLIHPQSTGGILKWCCTVNQGLQKDAVLTVVAATGRRYLGFRQCVWNPWDWSAWEGLQCE